MSEPNIPDDDRQRRLEEAMAEYLVATDAGQQPEAGAFLARHPNFHAELAGFLADLAALSGLIKPLVPGSAAPSRPRTTVELEKTLGSNVPTTNVEARMIGPNLTTSIVPASATAVTQDAMKSAAPGSGTPEADDPAHLPRGTRVRYFGDFELIRELGAGAWASSTRPVKSVSTGRSRSR